MNRREFIRSTLAAGAALTLARQNYLPSQPTKEVTVVCTTTHNGATFVVFDDMPATIFVYEHIYDFQPKAGDRLLIRV